MLNLVQQTVLVAGQTNKTISYHRRLSALAGAMKSSSQAKSMTKDKKALLENSGKGLFGKDFHEQITDAKKIKAQKRSKELLFNVFQQQRTNKRFSTGPPQSKLPRQAPSPAKQTLASSKEAMISVPEESSTATTRPSSKTQVNRTATFVKEIPQLQYFF